MAEFHETAGEFVRNLIHSIQEEAGRLPSPASMMDSLRDFDPTPEHITGMADRCADAITSFGKVLAGMVQGARESGNRNGPMPEHIDIPDDLSDL